MISCLWVVHGKCGVFSPAHAHQAVLIPFPQESHCTHGNSQYNLISNEQCVLCDVELIWVLTCELIVRMTSRSRTVCHVTSVNTASMLTLNSVLLDCTTSSSVWDREFHSTRSDTRWKTSHQVNYIFIYLHIL